MTKRIRVGVIFGGKSGEHEVSVQSARSVVSSLDPAKYEVIPIGIHKSGRWLVGPQAERQLRLAGERGFQSAIEAPGESELGPVSTGTEHESLTTSVLHHSAEVYQAPTSIVNEIDVVIPVLHGSFGEDGTIQGMFELMNVPYVGAGVLASAVGMDKVFMKRLFATSGLPQVKYTYCSRKTWETKPASVIDDVEQNIGYPCFVKPANLGSSVGISKAKNRDELRTALTLAARFDRKLIVEEGRDVREIEVGVLGNNEPRASVPGEIIPSNEFYDYNAKYLDGQSAMVIPANISPEVSAEIRELAIRAYQSIDCSGLARVDFFLERGTDQVLINEINTMPGFTQFSMYPKLWEATGIPYDTLVDTLIQLALERHADKQKTVIDFKQQLETE